MEMKNGVNQVWTTQPAEPLLYALSLFPALRFVIFFLSSFSLLRADPSVVSPGCILFHPKGEEKQKKEEGKGRGEKEDKK